MGFKMSVHFKSASEFIDGALQNKGNRHKKVTFTIYITKVQLYVT